MGYILPNKINDIEVNTYNNPTVTLTSVQANYNLIPIVIPDYTGVLKYAFLSVHITNWRNTSGAVVNFLSGGTGSVQIEDTASSWHNAILFSEVLRCDLSQYCHGEAVIPGGTDISSHITAGATQDLRFYQVLCNVNNLNLYGVYCKLRLYFE